MQLGSSSINSVRLGSGSIKRSALGQSIVQGSDPYFRPRVIDTALWLDAADESTITSSGGFVSQWEDKSGKGRHVTQGTGSFQPTYSNKRITFDEVDDFLSVSTTELRKSTFMILAVINNRASVVEINKSAISYNGGSNPDFWLTARSTGQIGISSLMDNGTTPSASVSESLSADILVTVRTPTSTVNGYSRTDGGTLSSSVASTGTATGMAGNELSIGRQKAGSSTRYFNGDIMEIIIIDPFDDDTRNKVEGYLAHKWGITASLPSDHPYKTVRPTV